MDPRHAEPRNPKDVHADYFAGWLYSQIQRGPIDVATWNQGIVNGEAFLARRQDEAAARAATGKRNAQAARRRRR